MVNELHPDGGHAGADGTVQNHGCLTGSHAELATHDYPADAKGDASFQRWSVLVASRVEVYLPTGMTRHGCSLCGSTPAHRDVPSRSQATGSIPASFLCQEAFARGGRGGMSPFRDLSSTPESGSDPQGSGEVESSLVGPEEARPAPEGLGEAERPPGGSDEPGTSAVGPDWAVAVFTIILGGPRPMSFDSCLMGTVLSVPDKYYISV
jgi:hypothetical protein